MVPKLITGFSNSSYLYTLISSYCVPGTVCLVHIDLPRNPTREVPLLPVVIGEETGPSDVNLGTQEHRARQ